MVSEAKKKRAALKKAKTPGATAAKADAGSPNENSSPSNGVQEITKGVEDVGISNDRTCTSVLTSHPQSRDIHLESLTLLFHGHELIADGNLELNFGRRYALVGPNGSGKSTLLKALGNREVPIPEHIDIYFLDREIPATDMTALEAVMSVDSERQRLEKEAESLLGEESEEAQARLEDLYERLDSLDASTTEARAARLLHGLGFTKTMQQKRTRDFSGGWRMRIALARALFVDPTFLILDEPTNHLDLEACVWLEETMKHFKRILLLVSHSQDFMNNVCTNIIRLHQKKLHAYGGNYDTYLNTRAELEDAQMKKHKWEQDQISHMKEYIARFGHGSAKLARQAQSKEKTLEKMVRSGLTEAVKQDHVVKLHFTDVGKLPPPVLQFINVTFGYSPDRVLYSDVDLGVDLDSRVAIVGPNGAGKSTLLKLMTGTLEPLDGMVKRHNHLKIGVYHQHLTELLDPKLTPLEYMLKEFPEGTTLEGMRKAVGRFGITGKAQTQPILQLSDGLRSRLVFAWLAYKTPHILALDEPTNNLDMETIDSLARAINNWDGGMVLVSHDFRLISQVAQEIWVVGDNTVTKWQGTIEEYKEHLKATHEALNEGKNEVKKEMTER
ncbi:P-loop containing nucleoside triphosphate hydrolase protein [Coccomyxa subellipsoidea C-169]|uniref:P-loop containing nucleoside triphosphate hydrolase protein n=1 Tax=Coccomyxa subellipsoidea (strain C-169) TaxID=574566 RepID=I0Z7H3_COCSC|nr:P-loop containing nucleoside triphosphate hydrolase protein [Coccomyxa subellipsoidea C-169]EIE26592.1 P-loop containing nucleoside triphosphate hydrolase protein [Coccomyxa subellipsoidea C-169]|eukprot:XP_005651136.1 P-loop containing nucleoside triphosphate hydrolase protein [Coccomyxa subellipsoidea C-169]